MDVKDCKKQATQNHCGQGAQRVSRYLRVIIKPPSLLCLLAASSLLIGCEQGAFDRMVASDTELGLIELDFNSLSNQEANQYDASSNSVTLPLSCRNDLIMIAFENKRSSLPVKGCGEVTSILPEYDAVSHYQRFMVQLDDIDSKHSVMIRHTTQLAAKVTDLTLGDEVFFYGEYDYTPEGGIIRRTHTDPTTKYQHGWIEKNGQRYL